MRRVLLTIFAILAVCQPASAAKYISSQLSSGTVANDYVAVSGQYVAWNGLPSGGSQDWEIYYYDGSVAQQLTHNDVNDYVPDISGPNVAWAAQTSASSLKYQVFYYDGSIHQLADGSQYNSNPRISGNHVVWQQSGPQSDEIMYFDGTTTVPLTNDSVSDGAPSIAGSYVAWTRNGTQMLFDGTTATPLPVGNSRSVGGPQVTADGDAVWSGVSNTTPYFQTVYRYDGSTTTDLSIPLMNNGFVRVSGDTVVWATDKPNFPALHVFDGHTTVDLPVAPEKGLHAEVSGSRVVWTASALGSDGLKHGQIFYYDGLSITQLTHSAFDNASPVISGAHVAWRSMATGANAIMHATVFGPADLNADGVVNSADLALLSRDWLSPNLDGDANGDGIVNASDLAAVGAHWLELNAPGGVHTMGALTASGNAAAVPEPGAMVLAALGAVCAALATWRRRPRLQI